MKISVIGTGYVGLVSAACFAEIGHDVIGIDHDIEKIKIIENGGIPIFEEGLLELVQKHRKSGKLTFSTELKDAIDNSEIIFVCVNTPTLSTGVSDLSSIKRITRQIGEMMDDYRLIVVKSTVPVNTGKWLKRNIQKGIKPGVEFDIASNPEFLREGIAVNDFLNPDRVVVGCESERARELMLNLYKPMDANVLITDIESAEIIKHASNTFLAMKISFINAVSIICEKSGADIELVADGIGADPRIGRAFLNAGIGWGGACFPKDVKAFEYIAHKLGYDFRLLDEVQRINRTMQDNVVSKLRDIFEDLDGKTIGFFGLAFKPKTDDMRNAPSIRIAKLLNEEGVHVKGWDPESMKKAQDQLAFMEFCNDKYEVAENVDAVILCTEWDDFKDLDFDRVKKSMKGNVIIDGRNLYNRKDLEAKGFIYRGVGR